MALSKWKFDQFLLLWFNNIALINLLLQTKCELYTLILEYLQIHNWLVYAWFSLIFSLASPLLVWSLNLARALCECFSGAGVREGLNLESLSRSSLFLPAGFICVSSNQQPAPVLRRCLWWEVWKVWKAVHNWGFFRHSRRSESFLSPSAWRKNSSRS